MVMNSMILCVVLILSASVTSGYIIGGPNSKRKRRPAATLAISSERFDALLEESAQKAEKLNVQPMFELLADDDEFKTVFWQRKPLLITRPLQNLRDSYTMEEVKKAVDGDFLEAGRGSLQPGRGWTMASVSQPRGRSFEEAKLKFEEVTQAMAHSAGTVVFNSAGAFIPPLARVCLQTVRAFRLPAAINLYLTAAGQAVSAPLHTDKQDVFVLQTSGRKRWRVYAPPPPVASPRADPFARGKGADVLLRSELSPVPLIDTILTPGQVLYVPAGFPHTTDTVTGDTADSVHLTVGLDSLIWRLSFSALRSLCLSLSASADTTTLTALSPEMYFDLHRTLPVGFLAEPGAEQTKAIAQQLITKLRASDSVRFSLTKYPEDGRLLEQLQVSAAVQRTLTLHQDLVQTFANLYDDIAERRSPAIHDLSFFRAQPYLQRLEQLMTEFYAYPEQRKKLQKKEKIQLKKHKQR